MVQFLLEHGIKQMLSVESLAFMVIMTRSSVAREEEADSLSCRMEQSFTIVHKGRKSSKLCGKCSLKVNSKKAHEASVYGSVSAWSRNRWSLCCRSVFLCAGRRTCACVIQKCAQVVQRCARVSPGRARALQGSTAGSGCFVAGSPDSEERIVWLVLRPWRWLLPPRPQRSQQTSRAVS